MTTKIQTPTGYLCLPDERMVENAASLYKDVYHERDIPIVTVMSDDAKKLYRTASPFGVGYTDCFDRFLTSQISITKIYGGNPTRKIDFLEIS